MVFENLFAPSTGVLRSSGTVLVTHALQFLPQVDYILAMSEGSPSFCGTWEEFKAIDSGKSTDFVGDNIELSSQSTERKKTFGNFHKEGILENEGLIMTVEQRKHGISSISVWARWFSNAGGWTFFLFQILLLIFDRGFYILTDW